MATTGGDETTTTLGAGLESLQEQSFRPFVAAEWTPTLAGEGLIELGRLRKQMAAVQSLLVALMAQSTGRDTKAALSKKMGLTANEAREAERIATVADAVEGAAEALFCGSVTPAHLAALAPISSSPDAAELLILGASQSADEFAETVQKFRIEAAGSSWGARQRALRSVRFFKADLGCVGIRAILPTFEGAMVKSALQSIVDDAWRRNHPERADVEGGHGGDSMEQRLADALVTLAGGNVPTAADDEGHESATAAANRDRPLVETQEDFRAAADKSDGSTVATPTQTSEPAEASRNPQPVVAIRPTPAPSRFSVVVSIKLDEQTAEIIGEGPIPFTDAIVLAERANNNRAGPTADLYAAVLSSPGGILRFGRGRRLATALQRLALTIRDRQCVWPNCTAPPARCDVDHDPPFEDGGRTDVDWMRLLCGPHHRHRHLTGENVVRGADGVWSVVPLSGVSSGQSAAA